MAQSDNNLVQKMLQTIKQEQGEDFSFDAARIEEEALLSSSLFTNLPIKLLTIFGGFLATMFLMGFLMTAGIYDSEVAMLVFGIMFIVASEVLNRLRDDLLLDSVSVSTNIMGYMLFGIGLSEMTNDTTLALMLAGVAGVFILVSEGAVLVFLSVLVLNGCLISLPLIFELPELLHVHVGLVAAALTYMSLNEAKLISANVKLNKLYGPLRMGLVFSLIGSLIMLAHQNLVSEEIGYLWVSSLFLIAALLVLLRHIMMHTGITADKTQLVVYACCCAILVPTILTPSIAGALLVVLSGFYIRHRLSFIVGLLALAYFIMLYYYNLQLTLLAKSGILVLTGCLLLGGLYLLNRYIRSHAEKH